MESKLKKDAEKPTQNDSNKIGSPDISGIFWMKRYLRNRLVLPIFALIGLIGLTGIFVNSYASRYTKAVFEEYVLSNFGYDAIVNGEISIEFQNKFLNRSDRTPRWLGAEPLDSRVVSGWGKAPPPPPRGRVWEGLCPPQLNLT